MAHQDFAVKGEGIMICMGGSWRKASTLRRSGVIVVAWALALVLLASCTSGQATAPPTKKSTTTTHTSVTNPTTAPSTGSTAPPPTAQPGISPPQTSGLPACSLGQLAIAVAEGATGLSHEGMLISYVNQSGSSCTLTGYPK